MSEGVPNVNELLDAVMLFIKRDAIPHLPAYQKFQGKVALHVLDILKREYVNRQQGTAFPETPQLEQLLLNVQKNKQFEVPNQEIILADELRSGRLNWQDDEVQKYVRQNNIDNLKLSNPRWI